MLIGICDNERIWIDEIEKCCLRLSKEMNYDFEFVSFESGEELLRTEARIDILFLDIEMDGKSGLDVMNYLENRFMVKHIFFVSSHSEYVFDSFGKKTRGFITKPVDYERFSREMVKLIQSEKKYEVLEISISGEKKILPLNQIQFLAAEDKYLRIMTTDENYLICGNLREYEEKLEEYHFVRIHKSYLVNLFHVDKIKDGAIHVDEETVLPIGRKFSNDVKSEYKDYLLSCFRDEE